MCVCVFVFMSDTHLITFAWGESGKTAQPDDV